MRRINGWYVPDSTPEAEDPVAKRRKRSNIIQKALPYCAKTLVAVQAGGHLGLWPHLLSFTFKRVFTFEPHPDNFACLDLNVRANARVRAWHGALGDIPGVTAIATHAKSSGKHYLTPDLREGSALCRQFTIDEFQFSRLSAVFLDVEGYELAALEGARATIARCRPVVVLEENDCIRRFGHEPGAVAAYMASLSYEPVAKLGSDTVYAPR